MSPEELVEEYKNLKLIDEATLLLSHRLCSIQNLEPDERVSLAETILEQQLKRRELVRIIMTHAYGNTSK